MKRAVILTCGTSVLSSRQEPRTEEQAAAQGPLAIDLLARWKRVENDDTELAALIDDPKARIPSHFDMTALEREFLGVGRRFISKQQPDDKGHYGQRLRQFGAEAESLLRRTVGKGPDDTVLEDDDRVALLVSETSQGFISGLIIALLIGREARVWQQQRSPETEHHRPGARWQRLELTSQSEDTDSGRPAPVDIFIVEGLTVEGDDSVLSDLRSCAVAICGALIRTVPTRPDRLEGWADVRDVEVELTGGYKVTLPLIHTLLGYFGTFVDADLTVFLRHDRSPDRWIPSALRRLRLDEVQSHLKELRQVRENPGHDPASLSLHGFGWSDRDRQRHLTPEGWGLLELQALD